MDKSGKHRAMNFKLRIFTLHSVVKFVSNLMVNLTDWPETLNLYIYLLYHVFYARTGIG